jgi:hypothetical protein
MNEAGLVMAGLYLAESDYGEPDDRRTISMHRHFRMDEPPRSISRCPIPPATRRTMAGGLYVLDNFGALPTPWHSSPPPTYDSSGR